jgi:hypothetical protein
VSMTRSSAELVAGESASIATQIARAALRLQVRLFTRIMVSNYSSA